ncbi:MAG TPA: heavy metal-binding domain-containing protein [Chitinophagaceae bacterium]
MKKLLILLLVVTAASTSFAQTGKDKTPPNKTTTAVKYTCPMHPEVLLDKPGKCPKCGMTLVAKKPKPTADSTAKKKP